MDDIGKNAEVGTPSAKANDPELRSALRMVTRLHLDARDLRHGNHLPNEHLADTIVEAADLIERLIGRMR